MALPHSTSLLFPLLVLLLLSFSPAHPTCHAQCSKAHTVRGRTKLFANCNDLGAQGAHIAWTLQAQNDTLEVLFSGTALSPAGWVGWGLNPSGLSMDGTQAFIAFRAPNGSTLLTYSLLSNTELGAPLACTPISLHVLDMGVEINGSRIDIFVSLSLPSINQTDSSTTVLNHVWNRGPSVSKFQPAPHSLAAADLSGLKAIDVSSGEVADEASQQASNVLQNRHAILNTVGWGIILPCGVIVARYLRPIADPAWFYVHVVMQVVGYGLGVSGWATGLRLGGDSSGADKRHRAMGMALFSISTLQVLAILLRPKKDHKIRRAWNVYHYILGFTIVALGITNIFFGFDILLPPAKWRHAYIGVLIGLATLAIVLEVTFWIHKLWERNYSQGKMQGMTLGGAYRLDKGPIV